MSSKLQQTYAHYKKEAVRLQRALSEVHAKLVALEEAGAIEDADQTVVPVSVGGEDEDMSLTKWVEEIINRLPSGSKMRRVQIADALDDAGYKNKSPHFDVTLFKTLIRLHKRGRINGEKVDGKWWFFPIE